MKIGDRVVLTRTLNPHLRAGTFGTIYRDENTSSPNVKWDNYMGRGHTDDSRSCWVVSKEYFKPAPKRKTVI